VARVILVNPAIYDFAAFDLWARPLGLLYLAASLENHGHEVRIVDALSRFHPSVAGVRGKYGPRRRRYGTGAYFWREAEKPACYSHIPRIYKRFGLPEEALGRELAAGPRPDVVGVTSGMTYWYLGAAEAVRIVRDIFPGAPVVLGGTYATLCADHATSAVRPDYVVSGPGEGEMLRLVARLAGGRAAEKDAPFAELPNPAYHLLPRFESASVLTGRGCPFRCAYCASKILAPKLERRRPAAVVDEIESYRARFGVIDVAFFDDALLWDADGHAKIIFEEIARRGLGMRFHTPNGLHSRYVDAEAARLMKAAGFATIRLSLETIAPKRESDSDHKVKYEDFLRAVGHLRAAGFTSEGMGAYVLIGLPGESTGEAARNIAAAHAAGVAVRLAHFSPIPGTEYFEKARAAAGIDLSEPLMHNNTIVPAGGPGAYEKYEELKDLAAALNGELRKGRVVLSMRDVEKDPAAALEDMRLSK